MQCALPIIGRPSWGDEVRKDWDERARKDPFFFVDSARAWSGPDEFFAAGTESYRRLVEPELRALGVDPAGKRLLELGCGVGRMTGPFAERFGRVVAVDVSGEMLRLGQRYLAGAPNVDWVQVSGADLSPFPDAIFDVAFTHLVLQHVPDEATALRLVQEMLRVLRPGGAFLIEFNSQPRDLSRRGRVARVVGLDGLLRRALARRTDPLQAGPTWDGAVLDVRRVLEAVWERGGAVTSLEGWRTTETWCRGIRRT
jgi:SAM-dependent methyltransferase